MASSANKSILIETTESSPISDTPAIPGSIQSVDLNGPAGRLEALLNEGHPEAPYATLICHPHPLGGGTMHNKVVYHAAKVFQGLGWPVLRFNFRGTGLSEGSHDGRAEVGDVRAGLDWLTNRYNRPIVAAGFSFGAAMGLKACCSTPETQGFAALGLPTHAEGRDYTYPYLAGCIFPKLFLSGDRDQYAPIGQLRAVTESASEPKELLLIQDADHFFSGKLIEMQSTLNDWLRRIFPAAGKPLESSTLESPVR